MTWNIDKLNSLEAKNGFRLRGTNTTRFETFIDAAFAFTVTMLVISIGDIPGNYDELILALKGVPAFLLSFTTVMLFYLNHRKWSRRYGLEDGLTMLISLGLIFLMLVYVYPLRLMFSALAGWISVGFLPSEFRLNHASELAGLFAIYGLGFSIMSGLMTLLYQRSRKMKNSLMLNKIELYLTKQEIILWLILSITGFVSAMVALVLPLKIGIYAGFVYFTLPFSMNFTAFYFSKQAKRIKDEK